jgi:hypothetical protein
VDKRVCSILIPSFAGSLLLVRCDKLAKLYVPEANTYVR